MKESKQNLHTLINILVKKVLPGLGFFILTYVGFLILVSQVGWLAKATKTKNLTGKSAYTLTRFREINNVKDVDILFSGSSHAFRSFDPRIFSEHELKTFNTGSGSQSPLNSYYVLEQYLRETKPKVLVFETYWRVIKGDGAESSLDLATNTPVSRPMVEMSIKTQNFPIINSILANYVGRLVKPLNDYEQKVGGRQQYVGRGYAEVTSSEGIDKDIAKIRPNRAKLSNKQLAYVDKIIELAQSQGVEVLLVRSPISEEDYRSVVNYEDTVKPFNEIAGRYGVDFVDFNDPKFNSRLDLVTTRDFFTKGHLTQSGVEKYNKVFHEEFVRRFNLKQ